MLVIDIRLICRQDRDNILQSIPCYSINFAGLKKNFEMQCKMSSTKFWNVALVVPWNWSNRIPLFLIFMYVYFALLGFRSVRGLKIQKNLQNCQKVLKLLQKIIYNRDKKKWYSVSKLLRIWSKVYHLTHIYPFLQILHSLLLTFQFQ